MAVKTPFPPETEEADADYLDYIYEGAEAKAKRYFSVLKKDRRTITPALSAALRKQAVMYANLEAPYLHRRVPNISAQHANFHQTAMAIGWVRALEEAINT